MVRSSLAVAALALLLIGAGTASASAPPGRPKAMLEAHLHNTNGNDWHVQVEVNGTGRQVKTLILWAETCDETAFSQNVPIADDGSFSVSRPLEDHKGTWSVQGKFDTPDQVTGTWSLARGTCVISNHPFVARGGQGHFLRGNPGGYAPERILDSTFFSRHLRHFQRLTLAVASQWNTLAKARAHGYKANPSIRCPGFFHARRHGARMSGRVLDPVAPQALVFWCGSDNTPVLAAAMFRAPGSSKPPTYNRMIQWHKHRADATWMTHLWLVGDPRAAWAACAPFPAFEAAGLLHYEAYSSSLPIDEPCPGNGPGQP